MARVGRPERNRAARSFGQLRRFHHVINSDRVFGTHRRIDWADLTGESWILAATDSIARTILEDEFRQRGLTVPDAAIATYSMQLRLQLLTTGGYLTVMTEQHYKPRHVR